LIVDLDLLIRSCIDGSTFDHNLNIIDENFLFYGRSIGDDVLACQEIFRGVQSYINGWTTTMGAGVVNLAPRDIAMQAPNTFRVENETYTSPYYYSYVLNTDAYTTDHSLLLFLLLEN
jgi:hypothetical protein